ncbi:outer membrane beta-barrel protein [Bdellovibrio bacteriovorus]|uniref:outer membrane beta-barrel protein n=1 Tax=Bdellovibrio bacteriovorus TaxID=959 RepID=UPI003AA9468E
MFSKVIAAAIVLASVSANAADNEFFFQSKAGQSDVTARLGLLSTNTKDKDDTEDTKFSGLINTGASYEYGINDQFSVEGALAFTSIESDSSPKSKINGLQDPTVTLKGNSAMGASTLRYGLGVGLALQKAKIDGNEASAASGGFSFNPYVGMDTEAAGGVIGGRLNYTINMERTIEIEGAGDAKVKGGNAMGLSAFYETKVTDITFGGALNYVSFAESENENGSTATDSYNKLGLSAYSVMPMGTFALIPRLDYDFSNSEADKYNVIVLSVAGRFNF